MSDLADAHSYALDYLRRGERSEFLNAGTGRGVSVLEVIECARHTTGRTIPVLLGERRAGDAVTLVADASRDSS